MNASEARRWLDRYNKEEDLYTSGIEEELRKKLQKNRFMTKEELLQIVEWKFQTMRGREQRIRNLLKNLKDTNVVAISRAVFEVQDDELRYRLLTTITGIGPALASTILTFYDPNVYGIFDIHSWRGLMKSKEPKLATCKDVMKFWVALRKNAKEVGFSCREIEKAFFKRDKEEG